MGTFGDCYPVPEPKLVGGTIYINIGYDHRNQMLINLNVNPSKSITLSGRIVIMLNGNTKVDETININNFKNSKPLSIANTVKLFEENNHEHNSKQIVRKFLGDFLQGVEAVCKGFDGCLH